MHQSSLSTLPPREKNTNLLFLGGLNAGQTTLLRALAGESLFPPAKETIGTDMQPIKLGTKTIAAWDVCFRQQTSRMPLGTEPKAEFTAIFFTIDPVNFSPTHFFGWQNWLKSFAKPMTPRILIINQCDRRWKLNIKCWLTFAFTNQFNAIIETSKDDPTNLKLIIEDIMSGVKFAEDTLLVYRYNDIVIQSNPNLQRFAVSRSTLNSMASNFHGYGLIPSWKKLPQRHAMTRSKSLNDLSQISAPKPNLPSSLFQLQFY